MSIQYELTTRYFKGFLSNKTNPTMIINRYELITRILALNELPEDYRVLLSGMKDSELKTAYKFTEFRKGFYLI